MSQAAAEPVATEPAPAAAATAKPAAAKPAASEVRTALEVGFCPVTQEEFDTVSAVVRGRHNTLEEVNKLYEAIFLFFKAEQGKKKPRSKLTIQDCDRMGLKVTGTTAESRVRTLRQLKCICVDHRDKSISIDRFELESF